MEWISLSFYMFFSKRLQHHLEHRHQSLLAGSMVYTTDQSALCQQSDSNYQHLSTLVADQWSLIILMLMIMMMILLLFLRKGCDKREERVVGKEHQGGPPSSSPSPPLPSSPSSLSSSSSSSKKTRCTVMGKARTTDRKGYSAHQCTFNGRGGDGVMVCSLQLVMLFRWLLGKFGISPEQHWQCPLVWKSTLDRKPPGQSAKPEPE